MTDRAVSPRPPWATAGFEAEVIALVTRLVSDLPPGTAELRITRTPDHPEWPNAYFEVKPSKPGAAPIAGSPVSGDLELTVGHSCREFVGFGRGGTLIRGLTWQEEFGRIWEAVLAGRLTERLFLDARGAVIAWHSKLAIDGRDLVFRNGRREKLFGRAYSGQEVVTYAPYL